MTAAYNQILNESQTFRKKKLFPHFKITPEFAKDLFTHNDSNRSFSNNKAKQYAEEMKNGKWISSSLVISFSNEGKLINGQHRLSAIIQSGTTQEMHIETGLSSEAFSVMDIGKTRNSQDTVAMMGFKNYSSIAGIVKYLISYDINNDFHLSNSKVSSNQDIKAYLEMLNEGDTENLKRAALKGKNLYGHYRVFSNPVFGFLYILFSRINSDDADKFFYLMTTGDGVGISAHSPIFFLRKKFENIGNNNSATRISVNYRVAYVIKAWNLFRTNKIIKTLNWDDRQEYPIPQ